MRKLAPGTWLIDLRFRGHPEYIACYVLETGTGLALIDPGPASTLAALEEGLRLEGLSTDSITDLLLTHIHLDHAGATGTLVQRHPDVRVYVHRAGAVHMVDPERLLASAARLYGDRMHGLWGEFLSVPEEHVRILDGGELLHVGRRELQVAYTPGHAVHHVAYFEPASGLAWVGDTAGIRIDNRPFVLPVTPPPDVDLDAWADSLARIRAWRPRVLCPTHFGPSRPAAAHLDEHERRLHEWAQRVRDDIEADTPDDAAAAAFARAARSELRDALPAGDVQSYIAGGGLTDSWRGLARHWRKRKRG